MLKMMKRTTMTAFCIALLCVAGTAALAQSTAEGAIGGTVVDSTGAVIAAAKITAAGNPASGNPMVPCGTCGYVLTKAGVSY